MHETAIFEGITIMGSSKIRQTLMSWHVADYFPVGLFGSVMGLTGLAVSWRLAHELYGTPITIPVVLGWLAVIDFVCVAGAYALKLITAPEAVRAEFYHPVSGNLFGTIPVSLLLLPIVLARIALRLAQIMWVTGAIIMIIFALIIVNRWMSDRQQVEHATPAWIIPVVGMLDIPIALPTLSLPPMHGIMMLGLAVGMFFALPLFTLIFSRVLFEAPMPDALLPSLMILLAPFAVGFSAYVATSGQVDMFAEGLYALTLFIFAVLIGRMRHLATCCPFRVSWWAVSFPLAATSIAALRFEGAHSSQISRGIAEFILFVTTIVIGGLLVRTVVGVLRGDLRTLSS
jgi:tellurite resistance protein